MKKKKTTRKVIENEQQPINITEIKSVKKLLLLAGTRRKTSFSEKFNRLTLTHQTAKLRSLKTNFFTLERDINQLKKNIEKFVKIITTQDSFQERLEAKKNFAESNQKIKKLQQRHSELNILSKNIFYDFKPRRHDKKLNSFEKDSFNISKLIEEIRKYYNRGEQIIKQEMER